MKKIGIFLSNHPNVDAHKINFIIERLESENGYPRYSYQFKQIFSVFFSIIVGGLLTAIVALPEMFKTWLSVIAFLKPIIGVALMITLFSWFFEEMLFKDVFNSSTRKYYRLIQTLENYYLEKY